MILTFFELTLNVKFGDTVRILGPFPLDHPDDSVEVIDNLDAAKARAEYICQSHLRYHGGDTIEYVLDKHTVEDEIYKETISR